MLFSRSSLPSYHYRPACQWHCPYNRRPATSADALPTAAAPYHRPPRSTGITKHPCTTTSTKATAARLRELSSKCALLSTTSNLLGSASAQLPTQQQLQRTRWLTGGTLQLISVRRKTLKRVAMLREQKRVLLHRAVVRTWQHSQRQAELQRKVFELQLLRLLHKSIKRAVR